MRANEVPLLLGQHSFSLKQAMHCFCRVPNKSRIPTRCLKRHRGMLPIDGLCARPAELGADKSRGLSNRLQFDTHSVLIVRDDLERQRRGVMQYGDVHHVIIDLKSSAVERGRDFHEGRK